VDEAPVPNAGSIEAFFKRSGLPVRVKKTRRAREKRFQAKWASGSREENASNKGEAFSSEVADRFA
jgi:hypothetical protein